MTFLSPAPPPPPPELPQGFNLTIQCYQSAPNKYRVLIRFPSASAEERRDETYSNLTDAIAFFRAVALVHHSRTRRSAQHRKGGNK